MDYIPYGRQFIDQADIEAVVSVLQSDFLTTGPEVSLFEKAIASYCGSKYAVSFANGTAALHGACFAAGLKNGDEAITSPITFAASANCMLYQGAVPVFVDIEPDTGNIDAKEVYRNITDRTKVLLPVYYTGQPADMDEIMDIAADRGCTVIADASHGLGALYKGKKIGQLAHMTTISFHPVKHITTGEGGVVLTNSVDLYEKLSLFRQHGITKDAPKVEYEYEGPWYYEQQELGYNYRLPDILATLGRSQLKKIDTFLNRRREIVRRYNQAFENFEGVEIPVVRDDRQPAWHLYVVKVKNRKFVFQYLRDAGIGVNVHYIPVYHHPYYRKNGYRALQLPNCEQYYEQIISLPLYYGITDEQVDYVIQKIKQGVLASASQ